MKIGLISDTHGLLRPEAVSFLSGCDLILHGGDIGGPQILDELRRIAPVTAVRGNNDHGAWAQALPEFERIEVGEHCIYLLHDLALLDIDLNAAGVRVVIAGHSHAPSVVERENVLFVNPGSAGPRRFKLPVAAGDLYIEDSRVSARTVVLIE